MGGCKNDCFNPTFKGCFPIIPLDFTKVIPFNLPLGVKVPCFYKQRVLRRGKIPVAKRNSKF
jgi:hypothetical protein